MPTPMPVTARRHCRTERAGVGNNRGVPTDADIPPRYPPRRKKDVAAQPQRLSDDYAALCRLFKRQTSAQRTMKTIDALSRHGAACPPRVRCPFDFIDVFLRSSPMSRGKACGAAHDYRLAKSDDARRATRVVCRLSSSQMCQTRY